MESLPQNQNDSSFDENDIPADPTDEFNKDPEDELFVKNKVKLTRFE